MSHTARPAWAPAVLAPTVVVAALLVILVAFAWPASRIAPRDLPVGFVGDSAVSAEVGPALEANGLEVHAFTSEEAARDAIMDRDVYGAIVPGNPPRVLIASAASAAVAQALPTAVAMASGLDAVPTEDVQPGPSDDPRGLGFGASILPLIITSIIAAVLLGERLPSLALRLAGAVVFAILGGLAAVGIIQGWFGSLEGGYLANSAVVTTLLAAITLSVVGLQALAGRAGLALGAALMMLIGNPLSGATSAPELLPDPWGAIGQLFPPGAGVTLTRSVAYFDGAGSGVAWVVLAGWIIAGVALVGLAALRRPAREPAPASLAGVG